jgi:hypothetical protein
MICNPRTPAGTLPIESIVEIFCRIVGILVLFYADVLNLRERTCETGVAVFAAEE